MLIRPFSFTQDNLYATSDKNTNFNISKYLLRKVGISNSLCRRTVKFTIFKRQIKARGTYTPNPLSPFPAHVVGELPCGSQPTSPTCVVWSWHLKDSPRQEKFLCARVFPGFPTRRFYRLWLLRLLSRQVSPPRAFWALLVAFPALSLAVWIATSLRKF